jgi:agmatine deiminase
MAELPRQMGYRLPAEWEPHAATWLTWPHKEESWPGMFEPIPEVYAQIIASLSPSEPVNLIVMDEDMEATAREKLRAAGALLENINFHTIPTNDSWVRDYGPIFIARRSGLAIVDCEYNSWGGKYPPFDLDNRVPSIIAQRLGLPRFKLGMVLEGGSIDSNGRGTLLATESCLLNPNRNPGLSMEQIESRLRDFLGVRKVIWLGRGIAGDDTDGHVDELARFVDDRTVVAAVEEDPSDENYEPLMENYIRLQASTDQDENPLRVIKLPMPRRIEYRGQRLPASYANFYIANQIVLVPTFNDPNDAAALAILQGLFKDRRVIGIHCGDLIWGLGAIHCITQQQPAL